jgi:hypothetical protein
MKKYLFLCIGFFVISNSNAQSIINKKFFAGISSGANNPYGRAGINGMYLLTPKSAINIGFGIGGWDYKFAVHYDYYFKPNALGWHVGAGLAYTPVSKTLDSIDVNGGIPKPCYVTANSVTLATFQLKKSWRLYKNGQYYLGIGYAAPFQKTYNVVYGTFDNQFSKRAFELATPGGINISLGFLFGVY